MALTSRPRVARHQGMTLVEVLVASAIGLGVMLLLWGSMRSSAKKFQAGESGLEAILEGQRIFEYLRKDIAGGPSSWTPCNYPEDVLKELGYGRNRVAFATVRRVVHHWFTYYRDDRGPIRPASRHVASPKRQPDASPCGASWVYEASTWLKDPPAPKELRDLRGSVHPIEAVSRQHRPEGPVWIVGQAFWTHDLKRGLMRRWTVEEGWVDFGKGRVGEASELQAVLETSHETITRPKPGVALAREKSLLVVKLSMTREQGRPDLVLQDILVVP